MSWNMLKCVELDKTWINLVLKVVGNEHPSVITITIPLYLQKYVPIFSIYRKLIPMHISRFAPLAGTNYWTCPTGRYANFSNRQCFPFQTSVSKLFQLFLSMTEKRHFHRWERRLRGGDRPNYPVLPSLYTNDNLILFLEWQNSFHSPKNHLMRTEHGRKRYVIEPSCLRERYSPTVSTEVGPTWFTFTLLDS